MDLYATLGVAKDATRETIKRAFRRAAKDAHPDAGGSAEKFHAIELAHRVLTDDKRREEYDRTGKTEAEPDNTDAQAMSLISMIIDRFLADEQAKFKDLVGEIRKQMQADIGTAKRNIEDGRKYELRTIDLRKRVKGKGAAVITAMFDQKLRDCAHALSSLEEQIRIRERALAMLEDTDFEAEKPTGGLWGAGEPNPYITATEVLLRQQEAEMRARQAAGSGSYQARGSHNRYW